MERHVTFLVPCLAVVMLLAVMFIVGCDEERSLLSPEQEGIQAPGKGNPHINGNDNAKPDPKGKAVGNPHINGNDNAKPDPKGEAVGNPHVNGNDNAKPNPNGKAVGNPHVNGNPNAGSNDNDKSKGAVKPSLRVAAGESEGEVSGWVIINTTTDATDEVEPDEGDVELIALDVSTNGFLIVTVHLRIRGGDVEKGSEFNVEVLVAKALGNTADKTFLFPDLLTVNAKGIGNAKAIFDLDEWDDLDEDASEIYVKVVVSDGMVYDTGSDFVAVQLKK